MLMIGSAGKTRSRLQSVLFQAKSEELVLSGYKRLISHLNLLNVRQAGTLFIGDKYRVGMKFREKMKNYFNTEIKSDVNFGDFNRTASKINSWIKKKTSSEMHKMFYPSSFNVDTNMVLASALYFKGKWLVGFDPKRTFSKDFFVSSQEIVEAKMMSMSSVFSFAELKEDFDCSMSEIPFSGGRLVMQILLPNKKDGIYELERAVALKDIFSTFKERKQWKKLNVLIPKLKTEVSLSLARYLKGLGLSSLFNPNLHPDFSPIDDSLSLHLNKVEQKISLEISEEGDTVAVVTPPAADWEEEAEFVVDHPFLFYIRDKETGASIVQGKISEPIVTSSILD